MNRPTPDPSQEGNKHSSASTLFPSWEGLGVGSWSQCMCKRERRLSMNRWLSILPAALLAGCAPFESRPISPTETAARLDARRLDDLKLKEFLETNLGHPLEPWPLPSWDLETLTLAAFYFHPALDVARVQWRVAQAGVRTAGGLPNPTLGLTPGYDTSAANGLSPWIPFLNLDVPLETAGKRGHRVSKAR